MNILSEIVAFKKTEVENRKVTMPVEKLKTMSLYNAVCYSLKRSLLDPAKNGIIAEFKRRSPSKGTINAAADVTHVTKAYAFNGASAISILTDNKFFGGSLDDLMTARVNKLPLLRKDFVIDEYQVMESKAYGADAILLIAAVLSPAEVARLSSLANELGMEVILEVHNEKELEHITGHTDIIGINNRDLKTFEVTLATSVYLAPLVPENKIKISESGINTISDINFLKHLGFNGFLIGEKFMKMADPDVAYTKFATALNEKV